MNVTFHLNALRAIIHQNSVSLSSLDDRMNIRCWWYTYCTQYIIWWILYNKTFYISIPFFLTYSLNINIVILHNDLPKIQLMDKNNGYLRVVEEEQLNCYFQASDMCVNFCIYTIIIITRNLKHMWFQPFFHNSIKIVKLNVAKTT